MHEPIDYSCWNFKGMGENILHLFSDIEKKLWTIALPFQDKRDDLGHVENVTYFALKLLEYLGGKRGIIIPAAILHDVGWSRMTQEELGQFYLPNWKEFEPRLRKRHQEEGTKIANELLCDIDYPEEYLLDILEIISQHDTREGFISQEDGLVRDADKLWRYTLPHIKLNLRNRGTPVEELCEHILKRSKELGFFYSETARDIAGIEMERAVKEFAMQNKNESKRQNLY